MRAILRVETEGKRLVSVFLGAEITHKSNDKMHIRGSIRRNEIYLGSACIDDCCYGNPLKEKNRFMEHWHSPRAVGVGEHNGKQIQQLPVKMQQQIRKIARSG